MEEPGLGQLLELILETSEKYSKVKWLVTSRNEPHIERLLEESQARPRLSLELNSDSVAGAVSAFINRRLADLAERHRKALGSRKNPLVQEKLRKVQDDVARELYRKAGGTFLWVSLVFKQIDGCSPDKLLAPVRAVPSGLEGIYSHMMIHVNTLDDAAECKRVLSTMVNAYRPLRLSELATLADLSELAVHEDMVKYCGLLTITEDDETVYFVHQSAKDFLIDGGKPETLSMLFPRGSREGHSTIIVQSIKSMEETMRRDIYSLEHPGFPIAEVRAPDPDPLSSIQYACARSRP